MKRKELLQATQEQLEAQVLDTKVEKELLMIQASILETKSSITELKLKLKSLKSAPELNITKIVETMEQLDSYELGLKAVEALKEELF